MRTHQTIKEQPIVRFEREERLQLKPLAERAYESLVLMDPRNTARKREAAPRIEVERRSLATYARLAGGAR